MLLANVIFPAFAAVYIFELFFWPITLLAFAIEVLVAGQYLKGILWDRLLGYVFIANVISAIVGYGIMSLLPSGWESNTQGVVEFSPVANWFMMVSFPMACVLSIIIEAVVMQRLQPAAPRGAIWKATTFANVASYLFIMVGMAVILGWMFFR